MRVNTLNLVKAFGEKPQTVGVRSNIKIMVCKNSEYRCQGFYASHHQIQSFLHTGRSCDHTLPIVNVDVEPDRFSP